MAKGKVLETLVRLSGEIDPSYKKAFAVAGAATKVFSLRNKETTNSMRRAQVVGGALANLASGALQSGFRAVSNSMDSAIDRVDTLNSYARTMENLGFSVTEVNKASEALQKGIDGLPTTLPAITTMQQQYTALTGNIDKATELTVALNDATLAGGQGQEVASRAMEQWYKVIAKGKPDLDAWTSINSAMPAQMNQIAQSLLGAEAKSQDLFDAWKTGKVTSEQVQDAIVKLDKEGGANLASFAEQAHSATGGIQTSMANVKTAVTNGVASIIKSIGPTGIASYLDKFKEGIKGTFSEISGSIILFKQGITTGDFSDAIDRLGSTFESFVEKSGINFEGLAERFGKVIPAVVSGVLKNLPAIADLAMKVMTALVEGLAASAPVLVTTVAELIPKIVATLQSNASALLSAGFDLVIGLLDGFYEALPVFVSQIPELISSFVEVIFGAKGELFDVGVSMLVSVVNGLVQAIPEMVSYVPSIVIAVVTAIGDNLPMLVLSGIETINNLIVGITNALPTLSSAIFQMVGVILQTILSNLPAIIAAGIQIISALAMSILGKQGLVISAIAHIGSAIHTTISRVPGQMMQVGLRVVQGIWSGIMNGAGWLKAKLSGWVDSITSHIKGLFGIHSPATLLRDEVGKFLPPGIAVGFEVAMPKSLERIRESLGNAVTTLASDVNVSSNTTSPIYSGSNLIGQPTRAKAARAGLLLSRPDPISLSGKTTNKREVRNGGITFSPTINIETKKGEKLDENKIMKLLRDLGPEFIDYVMRELEAREEGSYVTAGAGLY